MATRKISDELGYEPCTEERCRRTEIHPVHKPIKPGRVTMCPNCNTAVFPLPNKRVGCASCGWRGPQRIRHA